MIFCLIILMKNLIVVTSYPSTEYKLDVLKTALQTLKKSISLVENETIDILLLTQYKILDEEILSMVDYFIYDKLDVKCLADYGIFKSGPMWWFSTDWYTIHEMFDNGYHFSISRLTHIGINFAKIMNYDFFYYIDGDFEMKDECMKSLIILRDNTINNNKKILYFNLEGENIALYQLVFGGIVEFYCNNIHFPYEIEEWINSPMHYDEVAFEVTNWREISKVLDDVDIIYTDNEYHICNNMILNKLSSNRSMDLYFSENHQDIAYLQLYNPRNEKHLQVFVDDNIIYDKLMGINEYYINGLNINDIINKKFRIIAKLDNKIFFDKEYFLDEDRINILKRINVIYFKNE